MRHIFGVTATLDHSKSQNADWSRQKIVFRFPPKYSKKEKEIRARIALVLHEHGLVMSQSDYTLTDGRASHIRKFPDHSNKLDFLPANTLELFHWLTQGLLVR